MFRLLSDTEVALNELLVACRESVDHYQDAIKLVEQAEVVNSFQDIANHRKLFFNRLATAIRELGDLPSAPDPDKEASEMIIHHLGAALSPDYSAEALSQRMAAEEHIKALIDNARATDINETGRALLDELSQHVEETIKTLSAIHLTV
jgi:hypothetical protein